MLKQDKERIVAELTERLRTSETLIVADYRGLTMKELDALRDELGKLGARFSVVKNTLTRRAAQEAGADALLALLEGPSAIAFLDAGGDMVAVAKAIGDAARTTRVLEVRGGVLQGRTISGEDVANLAKLPPADVLRGQLLGAIVGPLVTVVGLFNAPLRDLVGVIDARIRQLEEQDGAAAAPAAEAATEEPAAEAATEEPETEAATEEPAAEAAPEPEPADTEETPETQEEEGQ